MTSGNRVLEALPGPVRQTILDAAEASTGEMHDLLYDVDKPVAQIVFPISAVYSLLSVMDDGRMIEVATVGHEGFVGIPAFLQGSSLSAHRAICQIPGESWQLDVNTFMRLVADLPDLHNILQRYTLALITQIAQCAGCNRLHDIEQRSTRWILTTHDRVTTDEFPLTQEFLGQMLGVRRATVNETQQRLQGLGLISYSRGNLRVLDRPGLEQRVCECYSIIRNEHDRLLA